jgi:hypothetical protein
LEIDDIQKEQVRFFFFCQSDCFILGAIAGFSSTCGA